MTAIVLVLGLAVLVHSAFLSSSSASSPGSCWGCSVVVVVVVVAVAVAVAVVILLVIALVLLVIVVLIVVAATVAGDSSRLGGSSQARFAA